jgi:serine/threonine-protein kinase
MDRKGKDPVAAAPEAAYWNLALAPGAEQMAVSRWETGGATGQANLDVYLWEFSRKVETRLTFGPARDGVPVWSPNGKELAFSSAREGGIAQIFRRAAAAGDLQDERLTDGPHYKIADDWSGDGNYIIYTQRGDLMAVRLGGDRKPIAVVQTPADEREGTISPDGRWVSFAANDSGRMEVWVKPFPGEGSARQNHTRISTEGGLTSRWRSDSRELYYQDLDGDVMAVSIEVGAEGIRAGTPRQLFSPALRVPRSDRQFDVTPDGQRFLMILAPADERQTPPMTVVSNWQSLLGR